VLSGFKIASGITARRRRPMMAFEPDFVLYYCTSKSLQNPSNPPSFPAFCGPVFGSVIRFDSIQFNACCGSAIQMRYYSIMYARTNVATLTDRGYLASERYYWTRNSCVRECENVHIVHKYKCVWSRPRLGPSGAITPELSDSGGRNPF
jgi:hypothetical protein